MSAFWKRTRRNYTKLRSLEMGDEHRPWSPPPTYEEAINDRPPPPYSENQNSFAVGSTHRQVSSHTATWADHSRVSPMTRSPNNVIVIQPGQREGNSERERQFSRESQTSAVITTQPRKKRLGCNCLCSALQCTPRTCDCEIFCFNCLGFLSYLLICAPGVYLCWGCKKTCPETFGDCCTRETRFMESYDDREDSIVAQICWYCFGPCCCFTCAGDSEVCPLTDMCVNRYGVRSVLKKMTCYCGSNKLCDYNLNFMDEQAVGFICDFREVGCLCTDASSN